MNYGSHRKSTFLLITILVLIISAFSDSLASTGVADSRNSATHSGTNNPVPFYSDTFTYTISGQVKDTNNNPVSGVLITFDMDIGGSTQETKTTLTDANGNYTSGDLGSHGSAKVTPSKTGYVAFDPGFLGFVNSRGLSGSNTANFTALTVLPPPTILFSLPSYAASEGAGSVTVTVSRTDSTGVSTVDYGTSDTADLKPCSQLTGIASSRCDYANTVGRLTFAAGETSKTISIPLVDDGYPETPETFTISLRSPTGAVLLGLLSSATIIITDNDTSATNPIVGVPFFVRQQYIDFLGREPDPQGYAAWQNILNNCAAGDTSCDRIAVSSGFFRSPEFQDRGYFIYKFYAAALGRKPLYAEFMPHLAEVSGFLSDAQLEANKAFFVQVFMLRSEYINRYGSLSNAAFVDTLIQTAGLQSHPLRGAWVGLLDNGGATRAQVLRAFTESVEVYQKFYNEAFVVMQYFGYLRRDPDPAYLEWIQTMNSNGGDYRALISGFINSNEYVQRFGP